MSSSFRYEGNRLVPNNDANERVRAVYAIKPTSSSLSSSQQQQKEQQQSHSMSLVITKKAKVAESNSNGDASDVALLVRREESSFAPAAMLASASALTTSVGAASDAIAAQRAPKKRRQNILSEERYVSAMEKIIKRDFFPDLDKIKNDLRNFGDGDGEVGQQLYKGRKKRRRALGGGGDYDDDDDDESSSLEINDNVNLDTFLAHNTSEDNASFSQLHERDVERHRKKFAWAASTAARNRQQLLTTGTIDYDHSSRTPQTTRYSVKNALMYYPDGIAPPPTLSSSSLASRNRPTIVHENISMPPPSSTTAHRLIPKDNGQGEWDDGTASSSSSSLSRSASLPSTPRVNGFSLLRTPIAERGGGPFYVQQLSSRDKIAHNLSERKAATAAATASRATTTSSSSKLAQSPLYQKLQKRNSSNRDMQLQRSYQSPLLLTSKGSGGGGGSRGRFVNTPTPVPNRLGEKTPVRKNK